MTRGASAVAFRLLLVATAAAVLLLDMTLAHVRATRDLPVKAAGDCSSSSPAASSASAPPGFTAAFGACGDSEPPSGARR